MGKIVKTERGHRIEASVWGERVSEPHPDAMIPDGRIVTVTFSFIQEEDASRAQVEDAVEQALNEHFSLTCDPMLTDTGVSTDREILVRKLVDDTVRSLNAKAPPQPGKEG